MKKYCVTSSNFEGEVYYSFDVSGLLTDVQFVAIVDRSTHLLLCKQVPPTIDTLMLWKERSQKMIITEVKPDLTFDNFYKQYNYKVGKKEAEKAWKRLTDAEKIKAIAMIPIYNKWLSVKKIAKVYPATYLNQERYNDEYK